MLIEGMLTDAVAELGYRRIRPLVYKASWLGGPVEHFLTFTVWGSGDEFLSGHFGFRERHAQDFGIECVRLYGGAVYGALQYDPEIGCSMSFSLGGLVGWKPRGSFQLTTTPMEIIAAVIKSSVQERVLPLVSELNNEDQLLYVLIHDSDSFRWTQVNSAMRAAQVIYLASRQMMDWGEIELSLAPFRNLIAGQLARGKDPDAFLNDVRAHYLEMVDRLEAKPARTLQ